MCLWTHLREIPRSGWQGQRVRASVTVKAAAVLPSTEAWRLTPQSGLRRRTGTGRGPSPAPSPHCRQGAHIPPVGRAGLGRGGRSLASQSWREVYFVFTWGNWGMGRRDFPLVLFTCTVLPRDVRSQDTVPSPSAVPIRRVSPLQGPGRWALLCSLSAGAVLTAK